jgi:hypothetical protein
MPEYKIVKTGGDAPPAQVAATRKTIPKTAPRVIKKTMRTYPRGVLKRGGKAVAGIKAVSDPAKPPPMAPGRKSTLRILTESGAKRRRETIHKKVKAMGDAEIRKTLRRSGLTVSDKTPPHIAKEILEGGLEAGMIVSK